MRIYSYHCPVHKVFAALSDPNRLRIVSILRDGPLNVSEVSFVLGLTHSNASRHLKSLLDCGIVRRRGASGWAWYSLDTSEPLIRDVCRLAAAASGEMPEHDADMRGLARCYEVRRATSKEFFARLAPDWARLSALLPDPSLYSSEIASCIPSRGTIAELGCGTGSLFPVMSGEGRSIIGIDSSPEMLSAARATAGRLGISSSVDLRLGEVEHLPLADESVDCALAHMVLHHLSHPSDLAAEAARVLKPGCALVLVELAEHGNSRLRRLHGDLWPGFDPGQIVRWMEPAGLNCGDALALAGGRAFLLECRRKERK